MECKWRTARRSFNYLSFNSQSGLFYTKNTEDLYLSDWHAVSHFLFQLSMKPHSSLLSCCQYITHTALFFLIQYGSYHTSQSSLFQPEAQTPSYSCYRTHTLLLLIRQVELHEVEFRLLKQPDEVSSEGGQTPRSGVWMEGWEGGGMGV